MAVNVIGGTAILRLLVNIAHRSGNCADKVLDLVRLAIDIQHLEINSVFQRLRSTATHHRRSTRNDLLPIRIVLRLPDPPCSVNHGMVQPEVRVAW
jgi:hypothetical protein